MKRQVHQCDQCHERKRNCVLLELTEAQEDDGAPIDPNRDEIWLDTASSRTVVCLDCLHPKKAVDQFSIARVTLDVLLAKAGIRVP